MNSIIRDEIKSRADQLQEENDTLKEEVLMLRQVIDSVDAHIYWKDLAGRIMGINLPNVKALGFKNKAEVVGRYDSELQILAKGCARMISTNDQQVIRQGEPMTFEESTGSTEYLAKKNRLINMKGKVIGLVGVSVDITERKENERLLEQQKNELEAQKAWIQEFVHNFHHDLRTPITGALSNIALLRKLSTKIKDELFHRSLSLVLEGLNAVSQMTDQLYLYTKEPKGQSVCSIGIDIEKMVEQELNIAMLAIGERNIVLDHHFTPRKIPRFYGDYIKLMQIIRNLLSNSVKYTHEGKIEVIVKIIERNKENILLRIKVADTGVGIAKEDKDDIFKMGYRAERHRKSEVHGTGFGLNMVKRNLDQLNGTYGITSVVDQGTEIWVDIPFKLTEDEN
ncbi:ATP-binding protein [Cysteiniphilum sp. 6C5]|uniref:ATP-binding protein n=1 Tax=unclassified Cysteiniphilum TaxID=2610889 RepID=UPI003F82EB9F